MGKEKDIIDRGMNFFDWINYRLDPAVFENVDKVFPELSFKRHDTRTWRSQVDLNGSPKAVVTYEPVRYRITIQGKKEYDFISYVCSRDNIDFYTAAKTLATLAKLQLPEEARLYKKGYEEARRYGRGYKENKGLGIRSYMIKNFSLETFFKICLGTLAILAGFYSLIIHNSVKGFLISCALGVMIILGINRSKSRSRL